MFANPWGLLALAALPAILALHLFRRRYERREVSALFLWDARAPVPLSGRTRERLRSSSSLLFELLAAACLALAFAGPRASWAGGTAEHLVAVLDDSASMGAGGADERAADALAERIAALPAGSRVTLIASGVRPRILAGPASFAAEARERLAAWRPRAPGHELGPALALGAQLAGGGRVVLATDVFDPDAVPPDVELVAVGRARDNVALTRARRARVTGQADRAERVELSVKSFARDAATVRVELAEGGGEALASRELELAPGAREDLAFDVTGRASAVLEVSLTPPAGDALALDDRATLAPVPSRVVALRAALADEDLRALGLGDDADEATRRWASIVPDSVAASSLEAAHVALAPEADGSASAWTLGLAPLGAERRDLVGPFLLEARHPLLRGLTLDGAIWSLDPELALAGTPLVSAGDRPLLVETWGELGVERGRRAWTLNLDPRRSSLQRSPDLPVLLSNLAELRRRELPGAERANLAVGEAFVFRPAGPRESGPWTVAGPPGSAAEPSVGRDGRVTVLDLDVPGLYTLASGGEDVARFAVAFADPRESDLTGRSSGTRASEAALDAVESGSSPIALALAALAVLAIAGDWVVLGGGRRGASSSATARTA